MKKLVLALSAALALSAFGCSKTDEKPKTEPAKPAEPAAKPAEPAAKPAEPAVAPAPAAAGEMPAECAEYAEKMKKCLASPDFPAAAKDQTAQAFQAMEDGWKNLGALPAEAKGNAMKAAGEACKTAMDGMKQMGDVSCKGVF